MPGIESFFGGNWIDQRGNVATITEEANLGVPTGRLVVSFGPPVNRGPFSGVKTESNGAPASIEVDFNDADVTVRGAMRLEGQVIAWENNTLWLRELPDPAAS